MAKTKTVSTKASIAKTASKPKDEVVTDEVTTQDRKVIKVFTYFVPEVDGELQADVRKCIKKHGRAGYVCHDSGHEITLREKAPELETPESLEKGIQFRGESTKEVKA